MICIRCGVETKITCNELAYISMDGKPYSYMPLCDECNNSFLKFINYEINDRPKGNWIDRKIRDDIVVSYAIRCSICFNDSQLGFHANFCPFCGADMRGDNA